MSKKAVLVGYGGIGENVYYPQLKRLGYDIEVVDPLRNYCYKTVNDIPKDKEYDVAIVCCPNTHHLNAVLELTDVCKTILVEKPGLANTAAWNRTVHRFPDHTILLVKNNLYRKNIEVYGSLIDLDTVSKIEINWLNNDRIPNPGSWFTDKSQAFGGVTHDLFPHLYCFMFALLPFNQFQHVIPTVFSMQRWDLNSIGDTDYGVVVEDGVYDVCDYAEAHYLVPTDNEPLPVTLRASWKEGYDDQAIHIHYKNGGELRLEFGLCPDYAYGDMIDAAVNNKFMGEKRQTWIEQDLDQWIHAHLEMFNED